MLTKLFVAVVLASSLLGEARAQEKQKGPRDLSTVSIEDLMNIQVTTVSKKEQTLSRTAAAVFVMSQEDIRRSGATIIPDLLRMVPGMDVAQINANTWAVSARGFNEEFSDKLLVLIDGRTVYTPTFGGVFWETVDLPLENISRIEVIRGPGGTIWGANAVNGVINIITKKASETQGETVVVAGGTHKQAFGTVQHGGALGAKTNYRVSVKYSNYGDYGEPSGKDDRDNWHMLRGGFRLDSALSSKDSLTLQGDLYGGREGQTLVNLAAGSGTSLQGDFSGGYIRTEWNHAYSARSDSTLRVSFDRYSRELPFTDKRNTLDVAFEYHFALKTRHNIVAGLEHRFTNHDSNSAKVFYDPSDDTRQLFSAFIQDEIALSRNHLYLTIGTKLEHNGYSGLANMPSVRLAWEPTNRQMFWIAVSKAERTPASGDTSDHVNGGEAPGPGGIPIQFTLNGSPDFRNESLFAYEAGYRVAQTDRLSVDLTAFFNSYKHLRTIETGSLSLETLPAPTHFLLPHVFGNEMFGETHGLEVFAKWKVTPQWTLSPGYAFAAFHMHLNPASNDTTLFTAAQGGSPGHSVQLRSHLDLPRGFQWDAAGYFVGPLSGVHVPSYTRLDTGLTWHWAERFSISVVGQNLLSGQRLEFSDTTGLVQSNPVRRSTYAKFTWTR